NVRTTVWKNNHLPGSDRGWRACLFQLDPALTAFKEVKMSAVSGLQSYCPRRSELAVTEHPSFELKSVQNVGQHIRNCTFIIKLHVKSVSAQLVIGPCKDERIKDQASCAS